MKIIKRIEMIVLIVILFISFIYPLLYSNEILDSFFKFFGIQ